MANVADQYALLTGYAIEGGFDGPGQPATCFSPAIALGQCESPVDELGVWERYEPLLDDVVSLGFTGVAITPEWARIAPRARERDANAIARYGDLFAAARTRGLATLGVIVDRAWPSWLGPEAWLLPWVHDATVQHTREFVQVLGDALDHVIVFLDADRLIDDGFLNASCPPWRRDGAEEARWARANVASIVATLRADPTVGPKMLSTYQEVDAANVPTATSGEATFLIPLIRGTGPAARATALRNS